MLSFFAQLPECLVGMEACGSAHHWARELIKLGHDARMMPPAYVKPYVRRQKNDAADAATTTSRLPPVRSISAVSPTRSKRFRSKGFMVPSRPLPMFFLKTVEDHQTISCQTMKSGHLTGIPQMARDWTVRLWPVWVRQAMGKNTHSRSSIRS